MSRNKVLCAEHWPSFTWYNPVWPHVQGYRAEQWQEQFKMESVRRLMWMHLTKSEVIAHRIALQVSSECSEDKAEIRFLILGEWVNTGRGTYELPCRYCLRTLLVFDEEVRLEEASFKASNIELFGDFQDNLKPRWSAINNGWQIVLTCRHCKTSKTVMILRA